MIAEQTISVRRAKELGADPAELNRCVERSNRLNLYANAADIQPAIVGQDGRDSGSVEDRLDRIEHMLCVLLAQLDPRPEANTPLPDITRERLRTIRCVQGEAARAAAAYRRAWLVQSAKDRGLVGEDEKGVTSDRHGNITIHRAG